MTIEVKNYYKNADGSDGHLYQHYYTKDGKADGEFIMYYSTGHLNTHTFYVKGKRHGYYKDYYPNGSLKIDAMYENGDKTIHKDYYEGPENGIGSIKVIASFDDGVFNGPYKVYYDILPDEEPVGHIDSIPHGPLKQENNNFNGKGHGVIKKYHRNGKLMTQYLLNNGIPRGIAKDYNESGELIKTTNYDESLRFLSAFGLNVI
jgi:antitoxin component YwqK of YwqJK toxin-antitoxin module